MIESVIQTERQTERQTDRQTDWYTGTDRQVDRQRDRQWAKLKNEWDKIKKNIGCVVNKKLNYVEKWY